MGCSYTKTIEFEEKPKRGRMRTLFGRDHRRTKVQTIHIGDTIKVPVSEGTPMLNLARKTEQTVLRQLREEGIIPNRGLGGVAFTVEFDEETLDQSTSNGIYSKLPGVPQYTRDKPKTISTRPRKLPPLTTRNLVKLPPEKREADAEFLKAEALRRKGRLAQLSDHRRELAAAKRDARQKEKRERTEAKMTSKPSQENGRIDKVMVNEKLERARINRELKTEEKRERTRKKLSRIPRTERSNRISTEEKLERARKNREKGTEVIRKKWEEKERKVEEISRNRSLKTPVASSFKLEI
ncbi:uncharacterized protein LOC132555417 [Ylistrum balloti]|uniref:uncharacterized protein LOC132555417 n=1 Tax=Ylistrum balloti TaxID=509963 RepID=UPI0029059715|nr:uncharacterized protein LOC132555417 [Ylistrum balloti]